MELNLPPILRAESLTGERSVLDEACRKAAAGAEPGSFLWLDRDTKAEAAVVLAPEVKLDQAVQALYATTLALGDALGALVPPVVSVTFQWPNLILLNGAIAGRIEIVAPVDCMVDALPEWLVIGFSVVIGRETSGPEPGETPDETTLYDEGCMEVTSPALIESFARHLLAWINRWQDDGFEPLRQAWIFRGPESEAETTVTLHDEPITGQYQDLDERGRLVLDQDGEAWRLEPLTALSRWPREGGGGDEI